MLFIHPSDEMYGADRVLVEILKVARNLATCQVWLPLDVEYTEARLSKRLGELSVNFRHVRLPILRRSLMNLGSAPSLAFAWLMSSLRILATHADIVYLNTSATLPLAPIARLSGARVVLHVHESWTAREARVLGVLARFATDVIAVSEAVERALPRHVQARSRVLYNGFPGPDEHTNRTDADGPVTFLIASRWNSWKGHATLLRAWSLLPKATDARLVVLGAAPLSGETFDVPGAVAAMPNGDSVLVVGETDDVPAWIDAVDFVVVPSVKPDPLPTIAIEAAAGGRATIASNIGGLPEIVADGVTGTLVTAEDPEAWAEVLANASREHAVVQGEAARKRFLSLFAPDAFETAITDVLQPAGIRPTNGSVP